MTAKTTTELKAEIKNLKAKVSSREKQIDNLNLEILDRDNVAREKNDSLLKQISEKNLEFETARDTWMRSNEELSKDSNIVRAFNKEIGENNVELVRKLTQQDEIIEHQRDRILELKSFEEDNSKLHNIRFFNSILFVFCIIELITIFYLKIK